MVDINYIPDKGDIVWLNFTPQSGHEQKGRRPAITLSTYEYNSKTNLGLFCPITSKVKNYPFEIFLEDTLEIQGVILSDQIKSLDWKVREAEFICKASSSILNNVLSKVNLLLNS